MPQNRRFALEVLFPAVRAKLFGLLFTATAEENYVRQLALRSHLALQSIQDELRKLSVLELVTSRSHGCRRFCQANRKHPLYPAISEIVALSSRLPRAHMTSLRRAAPRTRRPRRAHTSGCHDNR